MNRIMEFLIIASLVMGAVVLILFVTDPNTTAETIYQAEQDNYR